MLQTINTESHKFNHIPLDGLNFNSYNYFVLLANLTVQKLMDSYNETAQIINYDYAEL